jgi:hypothetical protein
MTDFRVLCAELSQELASLYSDMSALIDFNDVYAEQINDLLDRAAAALTQPEPLSLKEQALKVLEDANLDAAHYNIILRALEAFDD